MTREELIRDEDYTEEEAEKMILQNKLDKANERIEELEDNIKNIKEIIKRDIQINKRCIKENNIHPYVESLLNMWINYDKKLLVLSKEE